MTQAVFASHSRLCMGIYQVLRQKNVLILKQSLSGNDKQQALKLGRM